MQAKEFFDVGLKAYDGDKNAAREFFDKLAPTVVRITKAFGVLPGFAMAKCVIESGYMTNKWNEVAEAMAGVKMKKKAHDYNNIFSMNCFEENKKYLEGLPAPAWTGYRDTFGDWGPHGNDTESMVFKYEPWKAYKTIEDAIEDWCANVRYQAYSHGHIWNPEDLVSQLLATESYTPEGSSAGVRAGLHFAWQEQVMQLYEEYKLNNYDKENAMVTMTTANLDKHIADAYAYAHNNCEYGPTDTHFPPGEPVNPGEKGVIDCCGLVFRAFYTMGRLASALNINQIPLLCKSAGMKRSTDPNDVWKHHCVVCMQDKHLKNTEHVSHVYYSLGGSGLQKISKYDLGSNDRIKAPQPYSNVPVNEWTDKRNFYCCFYVDESSVYEDVPEFRNSAPAYAEVVAACGIYAGPGTVYRKLGALKPGEEVLVHGIVTNSAGNNWKAVKVISRGLFGYVGSGGVKTRQFAAYDGRVSGTDGSLALRVGAGAGSSKTANIPEGALIYVDGMATAPNGSSWLHVVYKKKSKKLRGFASAKFIEKRG